MRALLIDESETIRGLERAVLQQLGFAEIVEASDGAEALEATEHATFDLVLSETILPNMDGLTFLRRYRESGGRAPLVMITIDSSRGSVIEAIKAGVANYVIKPFTPDVLAQRVEETLGETLLCPSG